MRKCQELVARLPDSCPLKRQCEIFAEVCTEGLHVVKEKHPPPCYGTYCTCEEALDGGKVEEIGERKR